MMAEFSLTDRQAEAILNMRLRSACASSRRWRSASERDGAGQGARRARRSWSRARRASGRRLKRDLAALKDKFGDERRTRIEEVARGARDRLVGDDREGADHRHPVAARLDPGDEGPSRARRRSPTSNGARATGRSSISTPRPPTGWRCSPSNGRVYTLGRRQAAERARLRRAGAAVHRPRCRGRHRPAAGRPAGDEAAARVVATARASSPAAKRRSPRPARASSWSTCGPARRVAVVRADPGRRRRGRGGRREPQDAGLPAGRAARARRAGRASRCSAIATAGCRDAIAFRARRGSELGARRRKRPGADRDRPDAVARGARRGGPDAADRFPAQQSLRLSALTNLG